MVIEALLRLVNSPAEDSPALRDLRSDVAALVAFRRLSASLDPNLDRDAVFTHIIGIRFEPIDAEQPTQPAFFQSPPISLRVHLFGENIDLENDSLPLDLPGVGASARVATGLRMLADKGCLRVMVTPTDGADVLQELLIHVDLKV
jgi:hypothetical protein